MLTNIGDSTVDDSSIVPEELEVPTKSLNYDLK